MRVSRYSFLISKNGSSVQFSSEKALIPLPPTRLVPPVCAMHWCREGDQADFLTGDDMTKVGFGFERSFKDPATDRFAFN